MNTLHRFYIASKVGLAEPEVDRLSDVLVGRGYINMYDWTQSIVDKPFRDHATEAHEAAECMLNAVKHCDIIIVLVKDKGLGLHIETGGALVAGMIWQDVMGQKRKRILIVGEDSERSVFYFHKSVERFQTVADALLTLPALV